MLYLCTVKQLNHFIMKLSKLIDLRTTYEKQVDQELLEMLTFFHKYLWDGSGDENDPKFMTPEDYKGIEALHDKMKHMIFNIGCPTSIEPMLLSITKRQIKHWQAHDNVETEDNTHYEYDEELRKGRRVIGSKGFKKGKQLRNNSDLRRVHKVGLEFWYRKNNLKAVIRGHFRWNNRGYILSRIATDALMDYYQTKF